MPSDKVIGIDLGTTNSCVAIVEDGTPSVIPNRGGYKTTPSMVAIAENGKRLVGHIAKRQAITNAENTVYAAKRLIGRKWGSAAVRSSLEIMPYRIVEGPHDDVRIMLRDQVFSVPEVSAYILQEMKLISEEYLGEEVAEGGHHRARVLQRRSAPGDQGRRPHRRPRRHPHHQRADRGRARVRLRPQHRAQGRGLRPRRRHVRHLDPRDRQRRVRGHLDRRRHVPRRRGLRSPHHRLARVRLREAARHRSAQGQDGAAAPQGRRREGEVRAVERQGDRDQPAVHHLDGPQRSVAPADDADARQARGADERPHRAHGRDLRAHARRSRDREEPDRGRDPRRRHDAHAARAAAVAEFFGLEPCKGVHPDEVVALGAAIQGARAHRREERHPAPRRHAALARHHDRRWLLPQTDRAEHHRADERVARVHDGQGQPDAR